MRMKPAMFNCNKNWWDNAKIEKSKCDIFSTLLSTQNVSVARFARNVECDFFFDFQTLCYDAWSFRFAHHYYTWVTTSSTVWISMQSTESPRLFDSIWKVSWLAVVATDPLVVVLFLLLCSRNLPIPFLVVPGLIVLGTHKRVESWRLPARFRCCCLVKGLDLKVGMLRLGVGDGGGGNLVWNSQIVKHILFQRWEKVFEKSVEINEK